MRLGKCVFYHDIQRATVVLLISAPEMKYFTRFNITVSRFLAGKIHFLLT